MLRGQITQVSSKIRISVLPSAPPPPASYISIWWKLKKYELFYFSPATVSHTGTDWGRGRPSLGCCSSHWSWWSHLFGLTCAPGRSCMPTAVQPPVSPLPVALILHSPAERRAGWTGGTFTALHGHFSKGVVAAVALPPYDAGFARTLSRLHVAGTCVGARREAVAGVASVTALGPVVICLEKTKLQTEGIWLVSQIARVSEILL